MLFFEKRPLGNWLSASPCCELLNRFLDRLESVSKRGAALHPLLALPNLLTEFRFIVAPLLIYFAWAKLPTAYVVILILSFLSDALDGFVARRFHQESDLGAAVDSWADFIIYFTLPITAWWLWPELMRREALYVALVVTSYSIPAIIGIIKYGNFTSYHTWSAKLAAGAVGSTVLLMFIGGPSWPFHLAAPISLIAAIEQVTITLILPEIRYNVHSLWHVLKERSNGG